MLLRRVIEHVREQNWFAVGLDFLIVVTGVFMGIQVANWNAERQLAKYRELERLGFPSIEAVREPVREYYLFLTDWNFVNEFTPAYRETVRGHIRPEAFRMLWAVPCDR